ncbi:MAG: hypothetical protein ACOZNI_00400 [Myxococcota bacterium]
MLLLLLACTGATDTNVRYVNGRPVAVDCRAPTGVRSTSLCCAQSGDVWVWTGWKCEPKPATDLCGCFCSNSDCPYLFASRGECEAAYTACR